MKKKKFFRCCYSDREELVEMMEENYEVLNTQFVRFWASHKQHRSCGPTCSKAFVCDGFQKPSRFICGNVRKVTLSEELGKARHNFLIAFRDLRFSQRFRASWLW